VPVSSSTLAPCVALNAGTGRLWLPLALALLPRIPCSPLIGNPDLANVDPLFPIKGSLGAVGQIKPQRTVRKDSVGSHVEVTDVDAVEAENTDLD
jgi:hypothetical protein